MGCIGVRTNVSTLFDKPVSITDIALFNVEQENLKEVFSDIRRWNFVMSQLDIIRIGAAHLNALDVTIDAVQKKLFEEARIDTLVLTEFYQDEIYSVYVEYMKTQESPLLWASTDPDDIDPLLPDARMEFGFFNPDRF